MLINAVAASLIFIFTKQIVILLFSIDFIEIATLVRGVLIGTLIQTCSKPLQTFLMSINRPEFVSLSIFLGILANLGVLYLMLPSIGIIAAAKAISTGYLISGIIIQYLYLSNSQVSFKQLYSLRINI